MHVGQLFNDIVNEIHLSISADKNHKLLQPLHVRTRALQDRIPLPTYRAVAWEIPSGFTTDGASIPRFLWSWVNPTAWWILFPSIVHDYIWRNQFIHAYVVNLESRIIESDLGVIELTLKEGNAIMAEKMSSFLGGFWKRLIVFYTLEIVRLTK